MIPGFGATGHLPVGRYSCEPAEAKELLVKGPGFEASETRATLWEGFEQYLARYFQLEARYQNELSDPLLERVWLGGSFVSTKLNPRNVDATLVINQRSRDALRGRPGAGLFALSRDSVMRTHSVSPLFLFYRPVPHIFQLDQLDRNDHAYLAARGAWDDWWQRTRQGCGNEPPSIESCPPRRGYLEVILS